MLINLRTTRDFSIAAAVFDGSFFFMELPLQQHSYSLDLPYQLFRKTFLGLQNVWCGSFISLHECESYTFEIGMPHEVIVIATPATLPKLSDAEHSKQLQLIENELRNARQKLLMPGSLAEKLHTKGTVKALERKRMQFQLHYYSFVK